jgi:hypothetical protein
MMTTTKRFKKMKTVTIPIAGETVPAAMEKLRM